MAQIVSGADSTILTVDTTSKAARTTLYDVRGNPVCQKQTVSAATTLRTAVGVNTTTPYLFLTGSATKTIRVQRLLVGCTMATTAAYVDMVCYLRTVIATGGTSVALSRIAHDQDNTPVADVLCKIFSAAPTAGTPAGNVVAAQMLFAPITATTALGPAIFDFDWRFRDESEAIVLRGVAQSLEVGFGTAIATNAPTITAQFTWTEE